MLSDRFSTFLQSADPYVPAYFAKKKPAPVPGFISSADVETYGDCVIGINQGRELVFFPSFLVIHEAAPRPKLMKTRLGLL